MPPKILIVEDDFALADMVKAMLSATGFSTSHAPDGATALEAARKESPDLVLLDALLPKLGGFDVCRLLRSEPKTQAIKIIMMTGLGKVSDVEKAYACGASDYLIKPFDSERLIKKVRKVLGLDPSA